MPKVGLLDCCFLPEYTRLLITYAYIKSSTSFIAKILAFNIAYIAVERLVLQVLTLQVVIISDTIFSELSVII